VHKYNIYDRTIKKLRKKQERILKGIVLKMADRVMTITVTHQHVLKEKVKKEHYVLFNQYLIDAVLNIIKGEEEYRGEMYRLTREKKS